MKLFTRRFVQDLFWIAIFSISFYVLTHNPIVAPKVPVVQGKWTIQLMQQPLVLGVAGHNYLVLRNDSNTIVEELHGLATNSKTGDWKYIGNDPTDILQVFEFNDAHFYVDQKNFTGKILKEGTKEEIIETWQKAKPCKDEINALKIPYPPYGVKINGDTENSNSVAYTLVTCMELSPQNVGLLTPGWGKNLLGSR